MSNDSNNEKDLSNPRTSNAEVISSSEQTREESVKITSSPVSNETNVSLEAVIHEHEVSELTTSKMDITKQLDNFELLFTNLNNKMDSLENHFTTSLKYDASKEILIDQLYKELQEYRDDLHTKIYEPLLKELIYLYDEVESAIASYLLKDSNIPEETGIEILRSIKQNILVILEKYDVFPFQSDLSQYDPKTQQVVRTILTNDKERNKHISERLRVGFKRQARVIRLESVEVFRYQPVLPLVDNNSDDPNIPKNN